MSLYLSMRRAWAIRNKRAQLKECEMLIKQSADEEKAAHWLNVSQTRRRAELKAELAELESPADVRRKARMAI